MLNPSLMVDSKKKVLNTFEIVHAALQDAGDTETPMQGQLAGVIAELHMPSAKVKQFGNTLFVAHMADKRQALVRAFNADTAPNFVSSMRDFCTYAYTDLGIDTIYIPGMEDPQLARLIHALFSKPTRPDMHYQITTDEPPIAIAQLGPARD